MTDREKETALVFAAALMMQEVVYSTVLDKAAKDKLRENALILKNMADEIRSGKDG